MVVPVQLTDPARGGLSCRACVAVTAGHSLDVWS
jgi:hypothetical protein